MIEFEREDHVKDQDLHHRREEGDGADRGALFVPLEHVVRLHRALDQQEQAAADQHQVAPGQLEAENRQDRLGQADDPGQAEQERDAAEQRQRQADLACQPLLVLGQAPRDDRQEDQVVDAEHDLERGEREQARPGVRIGKELHHARSPCCGWSGCHHVPWLAPVQKASMLSTSWSASACFAPSRLAHATCGVRMKLGRSQEPH